MSPALRTSVLRHIFYGLLIWLVVVFVFATASYLQLLRVGTERSYYDIWLSNFVGYGTSFTIAPLIFAVARWQAKRSFSTIRRSSYVTLTVALVYAYYVLYCVAVIAPFNDKTVAEFFATTSIVAWVWDIFILAAIISVGYAFGFAEKSRRDKLTALELSNRLASMEAELAGEQSKHLRQRLGSHFVLNALSNIIAFVRKERTAEALEGLYLLSDILRAIAHQDDKNLSSLTKELDFLHKYLAFQTIRYPKLTVNWDIADETREMQLPSHILQPLVENAFKHGMQAGGHLDITITSRKESEHLEITVRNSLNNMPDTSRKGEGLTLTELRLQKHYNGKADFVREAKPDGYEARLKLPAPGKK